MAAGLPELAREEFAARLGAVSPGPLGEPAEAALFEFYQELRRWALSLSLIGPGAADEIFERHFGESLAVLPWLPEGPARLLDLGSGAGFPGWVIAAARPDLEVTLVEARERKWAFLSAVTRRARLSCRCLNVRVDRVSALELQQQFGALTLRAIRLPRSVFAAMSPALQRDARLFCWGGEAVPDLPAAFVPGRVLPLAGSQRRFLREFRFRPVGQGGA